MASQTQVELNLLAALTDETDNPMNETGADFVQTIMDSQQRLFPGWSREVENRFKQWAATSFNALLVEQIDRG